MIKRGHHSGVCVSRSGLSLRGGGPLARLPEATKNFIGATKLQATEISVKVVHLHEYDLMGRKT